MRTEAINISMMESMEEIRRRYGYVSSAYAFPSLYTWQTDMGFSVYREEGLFAVRCLRRGRNAWYFPCGGRERVREFIAKALAEGELSLFYVGEEDASWLKREFPGQFELAEKREDGEYVYDRREQEMLSGGRFASLRRAVNHVNREYDLHVELLEESNISLAVEITRAWRERAESADGIGDHLASLSLLENWTQFHARGVLVCLDGQPFSVTAGFPLDETTFDMSLAKSRALIPGLAAFGRQALARSLPENFKRLNAEEDLGLPGLRAMKEQMQPLMQIRFYEGKAVR